MFHILENLFWWLRRPIIVIFIKKRFLAICKTIGITMAEEKMLFPVTCLTVLSIE